MFNATMFAEGIAGAARIGITVLLSPLLRPWNRRWGATQSEVEASLPGDALVPRPRSALTCAITIEVPAGRVWPWLVQLGCRRGGWYSYDLLDNGGLPSAERILPEHQRLAAGDKVLLTPDGKLAAGDEVVARLRELSYQNGSPLLKVVLADNRLEAEHKLRDRVAAALVIIPADFSAQLAAFHSGDTGARTDLTNPTYTVAAVMAMTAAGSYTQGFTNAPRPMELVEIPLGTSAARNEFENYVPGLLVLAVVLMIFQAAMAPARGIESGVLRRLRLTPLTAFDYLGGTSLWLGLVSIAAVLLTFATAVALGFRSQGPLWLAVLATAMTSLSIIGAAFPLPRLTLFTHFGRDFALPDLLPPTHAVVILNKVFTLGAGLQDVAFELAALTLLSMLYLGLGVWLFQKTQMRADKQ